MPYATHADAEAAIHAVEAQTNAALSGYTIPATRDAAGIQAVLTGGGRAYIEGTYTCTGPLLMDSGSAIYLAPGAKILRNYTEATNPGGTSNSFIRTRNLTGGTGYYNAIQPSHDVLIHGPGEISVADSTSGGNLFALAGNRITLKDFRTTLWNGGRWLVGVGDDWRVVNVRATGGQLNGSGNGGLRFMGGKRFMGIGLHIESGDDTFQFVPAGATADPFFDISITDSAYIGCTGSSSSARLGVIVLQDQNNNGTQGMTGSLLRNGFVSCSGLSGGASFVVQNASSSGVIDDCYAIGVTIDAATNTGLGQPAALYFNSYAGLGGIKNFLAEKVVIRGSHRRAVDVERAGNVEGLTFRSCHFQRGSGALAAAVVTMAASRVLFDGCLIDGLAAGTGDLVDVETRNTFVPDSVRFVNCDFLNIPGGAFGVDVVNGAGHVIRENRMTELAGSTTSQAWRAQAGATGLRAYGNDVRSITSAAKFTDAGAGTLAGSTAITSP